MATIRKFVTATAALIGGIVLVCASAQARDACTGANCKPAATKISAASPKASDAQSRPAVTAVRKLGRHRAPAADNVMRGRDTVSLIAMLPWWRDQSQSVQLQGGDEPVLAMAGAFVGLPPAEVATASMLFAASLDVDATNARADAALFADPNDLNEIDLVAIEQPPPGGDRPWLQSLLAVLGGAFAAASAARFLFV